MDFLSNSGDQLKNFYTAIAAYLFVVFFLIGLQSAQAQETSPTVPQPKQPLAQLKFYSDRVDLEFADGRLARLMVSVRVAKDVVKTQLQVIENQCAPEVIGEGCEWISDYKDGRIAFLWVTHPDPAKINRVLKTTSTFKDQPGQSPNPPFSRLLQGLANNLSRPYYFHNQQAPKLSCKDDRWLQQMYQKSAQKIIVPSWSSEFMQQNEITGKNENMSVFQLNNSEFVPLGSTQYRLNITDSAATDINRITPFQETQTMYFLQNGRQCSIQLKNSIDEIRKIVPPDDPDAFVSEFPVVFSGLISKGLMSEDFFRLKELIGPQRDDLIVEVE